MFDGRLLVRRRCAKLCRRVYRRHWWIWVGKGLAFTCLLVNALIMIRLSFLAPLSTEEARLEGQQAVEVDDRRLAVVVPAHGGDLRRALASLAGWPKACSRITLGHVELVLYYAGAADDSEWSDDVLLELEQTGGKCFGRTSVVFGNLTDDVRMQEAIPIVLQSPPACVRSIARLCRIYAPAFTPQYIYWFSF